MEHLNVLDEAALAVEEMGRNCPDKGTSMA